MIKFELFIHKIECILFASTKRRYLDVLIQVAGVSMAWIGWIA